jgi:integrase
MEKCPSTINSITNYYKPVKLFCEMNGVLVNWRLISKGIKKGNQISEDRPPSVEEIKRLMEYPDIRIKAIVSVMISSGIRSGSWDYMKWKDITPISKNGVVVAAKLNAFNTKTKRFYLTFISSEAFPTEQIIIDTIISKLT